MSSHSIPSECLVQRTDRYECGICLETTLEPANTPCGHVFCFDCLQKHINANGNKCPAGRGELLKQGLKLVKNKMLGIMVGRLDAHCPHRNVHANEEVEGCKWKGIASQARDHLRVCPQNVVVCPYGCGLELYGNKMETHAKDECDKRFVQCTKCQQKFTPSQYNEHKDNVYGCKRYMPCRHGCTLKDYPTVIKLGVDDAHTEMVKVFQGSAPMRDKPFPVPDSVAGKMKHHTVCARVSVPCNICNVPYLRRDQKHHMKNYTVSHISVLHRRANDAERESKRLKQEVDTLKGRPSNRQEAAAAEIMDELALFDDNDTEQLFTQHELEQQLAR